MVVVAKQQALLFSQLRQAFRGGRATFRLLQVLGPLQLVNQPLDKLK